LADRSWGPDIVAVRTLPAVAEVPKEEPMLPKVRRLGSALVLMTAGLLSAGRAPAAGAVAVTSTVAGGYQSLSYPWVGAQTLYNHTDDYDAGYPTAQCEAVGGKVSAAYPDLVIPCSDPVSLDPEAEQEIADYAFMDPWGYFLRNCTSFVAWQLYEHGVPKTTLMSLGNGGQWAKSAAARGLTVSSTQPEAGAVAVSESHDHVAYVLAANASGITFAEYNQDQGHANAGLGNEQTVTVQTMSVLGFDKYIYFAPLMTKGSPGQLVTASAPTSPPGTLSIVAGVADEPGPPTPGPVTRSELGEPSAVALDAKGDLFIADYTNDVVEEVTPARMLPVVAGVVGKSGPPTPGPASRSELYRPYGVTVDAHNDLFIVDQVNQVVEEVAPAGRLSVVAGDGSKGLPIPGPATSSHLNDPDGVALDAHGDLFIADWDNGVVEEVTPAGKLSVVAGVIGKPGPPTPGLATRSKLISPHGVAVDAHGDLFISDSFNQVVEKVTPTGMLSIVAGVAGESGPPTPGPATSSHLDYPYGVAVDAKGDLFIADWGNHVVEEVTPAGTLSVVAGNGGVGRPKPGPATRSNLDVFGLAVDAHGNLFLADFGNSLIEKVTF